MPWLSTLVKEFVMSHGGIKIIWLYYVLIWACVSERIQFQHYSTPYLILKIHVHVLLSFVVVKTPNQAKCTFWGNDDV